MQTMKPLNLALVEGGQLLIDMDEALADVQAALFENVQTHGARATGHKAAITVTITLESQATDDDLTPFKIETDLKKKVPGRPRGVTRGVGDKRPESESVGCIWVPTSGSRKGDTMQMVLCTEKGEAVDLDTGEVLGKEEESAGANSS